MNGSGYACPLGAVPRMVPSSPVVSACGWDLSRPVSDRTGILGGHTLGLCPVLLLPACQGGLASPGDWAALLHPQGACEQGVGIGTATQTSLQSPTAQLSCGGSRVIQPARRILQLSPCSSTSSPCCPTPPVVCSPAGVTLPPDPSWASLGMVWCC